MGLINKVLVYLKNELAPVMSTGKTADLKHGYWPLFNEVNPANNFKTKRDYLKAAQMISWTSVCCSKIATKVAMTPWNIYDADNEPTENKDLLSLFKNPNPFMTFFSFTEMIIWQLLLTGNVYILKKKLTAYDLSDKGKYSQLWVLNPACVELKCGRDGQVNSYSMQLPSGAELQFPADVIVHIKLPNPMNDLVGMGKIQANEMLYNTEYASQYYNWNFFAKGGVPNTALAIPGSITEEKKKEIMSRLKEYQTVKNSHKIIPLTGGMELKSVGLSQKDMSYIEQRKFNREELLGIFEVPPAVAGVFEYANYANAKEQISMFLENTITPHLFRLQEAYTNGIVKDFEPEQIFWFDSVVKKDFEMYSRLAVAEVAGGVRTVNEVRETYLDEVRVEDPAADQILIPIHLIPLSESGMSEPVAPSAEPSKAVSVVQGQKKITAGVRQSIYRASLNTRRKIGKTIKKEMKTFFNGQENRVKDALANQKGLNTKEISIDDIFDYEKERVELLRAIKKGHIGVIMRAVQDINEVLKTSVDASTSNPSITARVGLLAKKVVRINDSTKEEISNAIKAGVDAGESISELKKRVEDVFVQARGYRAEMIARTESAAAYDKGSVLSYKEAGVEYVDVIGCTTFEPTSDCGATHVPIDEADSLEFHPNHTGCIVPEVA